MILTPNSQPALPPHTLLPPPPSPPGSSSTLLPRSHSCPTLHTLLPPPSRELKRARHIGSFESEEDAARAYDREAIKMLGPDAGLNFRESEWRG